ncbi:prepilin-type N-terminal cleavage/methylation domain-containing protein [Ferrimonas sp. SCSIO 43195]|uniref:prepilin-type N-terminal cleavage/methylation domain-containing protein n=1 Tax=Ferrimonas sp. SCSIO 43195 TaxID=2822844 RepID=UPI002075535F|nr:prepilin-type N-terminal cleavage/methylation domain-containing protein [Ferrimonas sp. SCSIO 43195]USD38796.1 prepilin-type N-terminal cleavage/methylation domain-containing protein [Ferrimonas sp. SCSIO 43195]
MAYVVAKPRGFTLVELIIVIVVLAVLAVVAAPSLIAPSSEARQQSLNAFAGAFTEAERLVITKFKLEGLDMNAATSQALYDDNNVELVSSAHGTIKLTPHNLHGMMDIDGFVVVGDAMETEVVVVPSGFDSLVDGESSNAMVTKAKATQCYLSLTRPSGADKVAQAITLSGC